MFFKSILAPIKLFFLSIKNKGLERRDILRPDASDVLVSLGVLIDLDTFYVPTVLDEVSAAFNIPAHKIRWLGFSKNQISSEFPAFTLESNLSWFQGDISEEATNFKQHSYTYLLNFYSCSHPTIVAINQEIQASFKIGFNKNMGRQLDFIFNISNLSIRDIIFQLGAYIHKISI